MSDGRPFIPAWLDDADLDVYAFRVFCRILRRAGDGGTCFESIRKIADAVGLWRPTVTRAVKDLADLGLVSVEARIGRTGIISVLPLDGWRNATRGGEHTQLENRPGVGRRTAPAPGRKTAHKGTPSKVLPEGTPTLSSPAARSGEPSRSELATTATIAGKTLRAGVHLSGAASSWSREACRDWIDRFGGTASGGRIGKALKPLVEKHGWPEVQEAWRTYLGQAQAEYATPERFAVTYGQWSSRTSRVAARLSAPERLLAAAGQFIAAGEGSRD